MAERSFMYLLQARWNEDKFVCVGLDSDVQKLPESIAAHRDTQFAFNKRIIDATHDLVCAYKPNLAFYSSPLGFEMLRQTIAYTHEYYPEVPVILDAKQADIGNTNGGYVLTDFTLFEADAVTAHPYLGMEAMKPFLDQANKGVIVLVRTSNDGAGEFQDADVIAYENIETGKVYSSVNEANREERLRDPEHEDFTKSDFDRVIMPMYRYAAQRVEESWNYNGNCAVVAGATSPNELAEVRKIVGDMPILIPGIGAQGGELEATVKAGANSRKQGMIINSSRGIIFASDGADFAEAARTATQKMHDDITAVLAAA